MKKFTLAVFVLLVIALAVVIYYVFYNLDAIVKAAIEKYGSEAVHTRVNVDKVKIELTKGKGTIQGLTIANPGGFSLPFVFSLGEITTKINIDKTSQDLIVIDLISIGAPEIFYEINAERLGNLNVINKNLSQGATGTWLRVQRAQLRCARRRRLGLAERSLSRSAHDIAGSEPAIV